MKPECNLICAIRGPVTLVMLGLLFAMDHLTPYRFSQTWPLLLIVFGLLSLGARRAARPPSAASGGTAAPSGGGSALTAQ